MIGKTISHYRILEKLGGGGMGVVYKAEDTKLKRLVALKFLPSDLTRDEDAKERFVHEAQAASALDHPNICVIHEIDETDDGQIFICMAYYEGKTLKKRIAKGEERRVTGDLPLKEVVDIAVQIAQGLARAHEAGITHRDIKPANLMITKRGEVKIVDFGLAKLSGQSRLTKAGMTVGTVAYMSPAQARGEEVDHRTDIWALGVVLYEMLTSQLPFKGEYEQAVVYSILNEKPKPLTDSHTSVPMELERVAMKALAKKPDERYQDVEEMLADLKAISTNSESRPVGTSKEKIPPKKRALLYGGIATLLILVIVAGRFYFSPTHSETIDAIAVLPLANLSGDPDQEYFADGMTEALISVLGQIEALRVISRTSVMQYKGGTKPLPAIGRELNVDAVVEGSVQSSGNRVNISVRLIAAGTEKRLWSESFERELSDVLTLQREVTLAIAREIKVQLTPNERARLKQTQQVDPEAYELYLLGRKFREKETIENMQRGAAYFEQAIAKDPNFALAYAALVVPYFQFGSFGVMPKEEAESKVRQAAAKALELDNTIAEAHTAVGIIREMYDWDWPGAEEAFRRAIVLNPSNGEAHREYGFFLCRTGRMETGLAEMKRAYVLDPLSEAVNTSVAWAYIWNRQYDEAIEHCQKTLTLYPNAAYAYSLLGGACLFKREYKKAISVFETEVMGLNTSLGYLGYAYALSGNKDKSLEMLDKLQQQQKQGIDKTVDIARIYTGLEKTDEALTLLEQAYEEHSLDYPHQIFDPIFDSLHSEPRFQALLKKMGLDSRK